MPGLLTGGATEGNWFDPSGAPDVAEEAQHLARESSLVCRQNAKLRAQLAELQAQRAEDSEAFRATLKGRPTAADLELAQSKSAAAETRAGELEKALVASEERERRAKAEAVAAVRSQQQQAAAASAHERRASDAADYRGGVEDGLRKERDRLHAEVDALSAELASWRMVGVDVDGARSSLQAAAAAEAERVAAVEAARRMSETHAERVAALQSELKDARERLMGLQRGGGDDGTGKLRAELVRAEAHAAELRKQAQKQAEANAAALKAQAAAATQAAREAETARRKEADALNEQLREARKALLAARQAAREQAERATEGESSRQAREARAREQQLQRLSREAAQERQRADEAVAARDALAAQLDELQRQLAAAHLEIERLSRLHSERSRAEQQRAPQPPAEPKRGSAFGDFVHLKRELAEVRQANDTLARQLAAGGGSGGGGGGGGGGVAGGGAPYTYDGGDAGAAQRVPHDAGADGPPPADATESAPVPVHSRTSLRQPGAPAVPRRYPAALLGGRDREPSLPGVLGQQRRSNLR